MRTTSTVETTTRPCGGRTHSKEKTMSTNHRAGQRRPSLRTTDDGFTLVEILIAIVLIGILSAVAVVGINSLTGSGSESACEASRDAAKAASVVYFAANGNKYPTDLNQMTGGTDPVLELPEDADIADNGLSATSGSWTLTMTPGSGSSRPLFECS